MGHEPREDYFTKIPSAQPVVDAQAGIFLRYLSQRGRRQVDPYLADGFVMDCCFVVQKRAFTISRTKLSFSKSCG